MNNLKEFYTTTIDSIFSTFDVPDAIDYLSMDIEGAESVVFPLLPFHTHAIHIMTIERPKEHVRAMLKAQKYVEVGIMGDYGDSVSGELRLCFALTLERAGLRVVGVDVNDAYVMIINEKTLDRFDETGHRVLRQTSTSAHVDRAEEGFSLERNVLVER